LRNNNNFQIEENKYYEKAEEPKLDDKSEVIGAKGEEDIEKDGNIEPNVQNSSQKINILQNNKPNANKDEL